MKNGLSGLFGLALLSSLVTLIAATQNAPVWKTHVGTWKVNLAKSKYSPASAAPKSATVTNEPVGDGFKAVVDAVDSTGRAIHSEYTYRFDGKDVPVPGDPSRDMTSVRKIDDFTFEQINKKNGKVTTTSRCVYAKDGKSRTFTTTGITPQGQVVNNVVVYDRQ
jgi:hypothetical protein